MSTNQRSRVAPKVAYGDNPRAPAHAGNALMFVRRKRGLRKPDNVLEDPRASVWQDVLAARRRWLLAEKPAKKCPVAPDGTLPPIDLQVDQPTDQQQAQSLLYKYVRSEQFFAEGMGYGEVIEEQLRSYPGGKEKIVIRRSQRTSTGRQTLSEDEAHEAEEAPKERSESRSQ